MYFITYLKMLSYVTQVQVLEGALDCWVFLSCLEVLHRIEGCCDPAQLAANCSHTVGLWAYATDKVPHTKKKNNNKSLAFFKLGL